MLGASSSPHIRKETRLSGAFYKTQVTQFKLKLSTSRMCYKHGGPPAAQTTSSNTSGNQITLSKYFYPRQVEIFGLCCNCVLNRMYFGTLSDMTCFWHALVIIPLLIIALFLFTLTISLQCIFCSTCQSEGLCTVSGASQS